MMPMLRQRSNGTCLGTSYLTFDLVNQMSLVVCRWSFANRGRFGPTTNDQRPSLPPVMRERLVGFRHAVDVFLLLDRSAAIIGGVEQLIAELIGHAFFSAAAAVANQPANRQRGAPVRIDLHRYLVVGATDAAGF